MNASVHHLEVKKTARYFQLGQANSSTRELWFVLHGYGQSVERFVSEFSPLVDESTCIVAPEGLSRFYLEGTSGNVGASWMTKVDRNHEIQDQIAFLDGVYSKIKPSISRECRIIVLGFSQGAAAAWRWIQDGHAQFNDVICWTGSAPLAETGSAMEAKLQHMGLHLVFADSDNYISSDAAQAMTSALSTIKPDLKVWNFSGGHIVHPETLLKVRNWIRAFPHHF